MMYKMQGTYVNKNLRTKANSDLLDPSTSAYDNKEKEDSTFLIGKRERAGSNYESFKHRDFGVADTRKGPAVMAATPLALSIASQLGANDAYRSEIQK